MEVDERSPGAASSTRGSCSGPWREGATGLAGAAGPDSAASRGRRASPLLDYAREPAVRMVYLSAPLEAVPSAGPASCGSPGGACSGSPAVAAALSVSASPGGRSGTSLPPVTDGLDEASGATSPLRTVPASGCGEVLREDGVGAMGSSLPSGGPYGGPTEVQSGGEGAGEGSLRLSPVAGAGREEGAAAVAGRATRMAGDGRFSHNAPRPLSVSGGDRDSSPALEILENISKHI